VIFPLGPGKVGRRISGAGGSEGRIVIVGLSVLRIMAGYE